MPFLRNSSQLNALSPLFGVDAPELSLSLAPMRKLTTCESFAFLLVVEWVLLVAPSAGQALDPSRRQEGALATLPAPSLADSAALDQRSLEQENVFAPATPGDDDIGQQLILKEAPKNQPFRLFSDTFWFWTSNAANVSAGELADSFYGARLGAAWQPRISRRTYADVSVSQQLVRYLDFDALDFESLEASASLIHIAPALANTLLFSGVVFNHITGDDFSQDLYQSLSARLGAQKIFLVNRRNSIHASLLADWDLDTDVDPLFRHEYIGDLAWSFKVFRTLILSLNYRFSWLDYQRVNRQDALHFTGATLSWQPRPWAELYATVNFALNDSSIPVFDYETTSAGGGLGLRIRF